jgi:predicted N-acetyltransferase YhbS
MKFNIRKIHKNEFFITEYLTRETFWNLYNPGCSEHLILHNFRQSDAYIKELDLIVSLNSEIIGHIISTKARIVDEDNNECEVLHLGPVSIDIKFQNKGLGSQLINYSIIKAKKMKFKGMILFGNPNYYKRFGFKNAKEYDITTEDGLNFDPFMALELQENALLNVQGKFFIHKSAKITEQQLIEFEKHFPAKEKCAPKINIHE